MDDFDKNEGRDDLQHHNAQSILPRCDELSLLGQYKSALDLLSPLIEDSTLTAAEMLDVLRATAQVFVFRGYPRIAKECLEKALSLLSDQLDKHQLLLLKVHHAFITIVGCGEELANDEFLLQARELLEILETFDAFDRQAVSLANTQRIS
jgi:tetratricopeptide (TPR) repeat protein